MHVHGSKLRGRSGGPACQVGHLLGNFLPKLGPVWVCVARGTLWV